MNLNPDFYLSFLFAWSLHVTALAVIAAVVCRLMRGKPGRYHAAVWTTALVLAWAMPALPKVVAATVPLPQLVEPEITQVVVSPPKTAPQVQRVSPQGAAGDRQAVQRSPQTARPGENNRTMAQPLQQKPDAPSGGWDWSAVLFWTWLAGATLSFLRWQWMRMQIRSLLRESEDVTDPLVCRIVERTRQLLFIDQKIHVKSSDKKPVPFVCGTWKTTLFLPQTLVRDGSEMELQAVIAHELGHIQRYDLAAHEAMSLLRILLWFLPPVWWMQVELLRSQDSASDECATVIVGDGKAFGNALVILAERCLIAQRLFPALGIIHTKHALLKRLEDIMKTQVTTLSRLSLRFRSLLLVASICLVFAAALVNQAASQQSLSVTHLGNYNGEPNTLAVDSTIYAEPYYAVFGRVNGRLTAFYLQANNGALEPAFSVDLQGAAVPAPTNDLRFARAVADGRITVFFYQTIDGNNVSYYVVDQNGSKGVVQRGSVPNIRIDTDPRLDGNTLYFVGEDRAQERVNGAYPRFLIRIEDVDSTPSRVTRFSVPYHIHAKDFDLMDGDILLLDGQADDQDPAIGPEIGVVRAQVVNDELVYDKQRWFTVEEGGIGRVRNFPLSLFTFQNYVVIQRSSSQPGQIDTVVIDWSDPGNPVELQSFDSGFSALSVEMALNERLFLVYLQGQSPVYNVYERDGSAFQKVSELTLNYLHSALGDGFLINAGAAGIVAYDLSDPAQPRPVNVPIQKSFSVFNTAAQGLYVYAVSEGDLKVLDAAQPNDLQEIAAYPLQDEQSYGVAAHHGLLLVNRDPYINLFSLDEDGLITGRVDVSGIIEDYQDGQGYFSVTPTFWNNDLFIFRMYTEEELPPPNTPIRHYELKIHRRNGNEIDPQSLSTIKLDVNTSLNIAVGNDHLYTFISESEFRTDPPGVVFNAYMTVYSIADPSRPVLVTRYFIPLPDEDHRTPFTLPTATVHNGILAYATFERWGLIDVNDPAKPVFRGSYSARVQQVYWYKNLLTLFADRDLLFYQIKDRGTPLEVTQVDLNVVRPPVFTEDRLYVPLDQNGIDVYQIELDETGVLQWRQHR